MTKAKKKRRAPLTRGPAEAPEGGDSAHETAVEDDPVTENRRMIKPIPEEGDRGRHSEDDPVTRERVVEESGQ